MRLFFEGVSKVNLDRVSILFDKMVDVGETLSYGTVSQLGRVKISILGSIKEMEGYILALKHGC